MQLRDTHSIADGVDGVLQREQRTNRMREQQPETDEAVSRIEFDSAELEREEDQTLSTSSLNASDDGSESSTATLCSTKEFSEYLTETTLAFVEVLGHNVMMVHSDQEPVLVQLKTVQNRSPIETSMGHGPRITHQSQSKIENVNQVINGVCWSMWLTFENLLREQLSNDSIPLAWLIRHAAWSLTKFPVKNDGRTSLVRVSGKAYTSQLSFGERVMYEHTAVPTGNLNQRWGHGIWSGKAPMTDECIIPSENRIQKAKSLHRVTPKEKFLISELVEKAREFPWNDVAEKFEVSGWDASGPRFIWTSAYASVMRIRDPTRKHVGCDREEHWLMRKRARVRERSEQELGRLQKKQWNSNSQRW